MISNILQYLEESASKYPDKTALEDAAESLSYSDYRCNARKIGTYISKNTGRITGSPVAVLIDRNIRSICTFMGVVYSGNFYVPIDTSMPESRIKLIFDTLNPVLVIDAGNDEASLLSSHKYSDIINNTEEDDTLLSEIWLSRIDTDPLYSIFTSGSTGVPKGVLISHRSVIDLVNAFDEAFSFDSDTVFGNQAPFDFDVSVKDIYNAMYHGAEVQVIPQKLFKTPVLLIDHIRKKKINTLIWAVSAMRIFSHFDAFEGIEPLPVKTVMFSGETMPPKVLSYWQNCNPDTEFVNLYGPTEITCNCTYHVIGRKYADDEVIPAGKAFRNCRVFLQNDKNEIITKKGEAGEICVEGSCLALGYWNNKEKTCEAFRMNNWITGYESRYYATGDIGYYNNENDIVFVSRKDYQIKHMGHRIELGEIEAALNAIPFIDIACCIFDEEREKIVCHYQAKDECKKEIVLELSKKLPKYMWPNIYIRHDELPQNKHGKIDRVRLKQISM